MPKILKNIAKTSKNISKWFALLLLFPLFYFFILKDLPSPTSLSKSETSQTTKIYDRNEKLLYNVYSQKNQSFVPLNQLPKSLQQATIAIEDKNFYKHGAFDPRGIARALFETIFKKNLQGGSTITQQLVKTALLTPERTIPRKIKEFLLSLVVEEIYSKDKILEMYLNSVPYGGTAWGVQAASETYFGKNAKDLTLAESALLAGLPAAPTYYSPFGARPFLAKGRQEEVLDKMFENDFISNEEKEKAKKEELKFKKSLTQIEAPHFVLYIKDLLVQNYGQKTVEQGGLKVTTSLDLNIQDFTQQTVASEVAKLKNVSVSNGAAMVTNPKTGEILAMVGSKDYFDEEIDGNVNVTLALRQPGSAIKPINYAVGLLKNYTAATPFVDQKTCFPNPGHPDYCPVNYDGKFHGLVQMRYALANSFNVPAVKMLKLNGVEDMVATASAMGITSFTDPRRYGLSLTLGGGEVSMIEMTTAFGVFASQGYRINLHPILKVTDTKGKVLEEYIPPKSPIFGKKVFPESVAFIISHILADNGARSAAFGESSALVVPGQVVSAKTGTTDDKRDNWTIGWTPSILVATWVGNNDNSPMDPSLTSGITGAAPIWNRIMRFALKDKKVESPKIPATVVGAQICSTSGKLPQPEGDPNRCPTRFEYFLKGTVPTNIDDSRQNVFVDRTTNDLPKFGQTENLELRDETIVTDPLGDRYCLTCPHPETTPQR